MTDPEILIHWPALKVLNINDDLAIQFFLQRNDPRVYGVCSRGDVVNKQVAFISQKMSWIIFQTVPIKEPRQCLVP